MGEIETVGAEKMGWLDLPRGTSYPTFPYVGGCVWYLELSRESRHVAQQARYQNVGLGNGHCLGTISSGCDF